MQVSKQNRTALPSETKKLMKTMKCYS